MNVRSFVPVDDIERIGARLAADARRCHDEAVASAIELLVDEIRHLVAMTLYDMPTGPETNGGRS